jgi:hypothetical protein
MANMVAQRIAVFIFNILVRLLAQTSNASNTLPSFPILKSRIQALNITSEDEVNDLVKDWQAGLDAFIGSGSQVALSAQKLLESRFAGPFLSERIVCPVIAPVACEYNSVAYCCYSGETCCYTDSCCISGIVCCNSNPGLCCFVRSFCCNSEVVSAAL